MVTAGDDSAAATGEPGHTSAARALDGIEHLQTAARELIQAARAVLDVAEELVADPNAVASLVSTFGSIADAAARMMPGAASQPRPSGDDSDDDRIQRIRVS